MVVVSVPGVRWPNAPRATALTYSRGTFCRIYPSALGAFHLDETKPKRWSGPAVSARQCMVMTCVLLGFWRFVVGERSRKHAIARLGPRRPALAVVWGWWPGSGPRWRPS